MLHKRKVKNTIQLNDFQKNIEPPCILYTYYRGGSIFYIYLTVFIRCRIINQHYYIYFM